jgi:hypothetical protein
MRWLRRSPPQSRIVYVDNDPLALVHARALLTGNPRGATDYIDSDVRDPDKILRDAARTLDFGQPVAVMLLATLQLISNEDDPYGIVTRLMAEIPPGSYLAVSHPANDIQVEGSPPAAEEALNRLMRGGLTLRTQAEVAPFFSGLELVEPGLVPLNRWRPDPDDKRYGGEIAIWGGVARKP